MFVAQELYYFSKGTYRHRKALTVYYVVGQRNAQVAAVVVQGERVPDALTSGVSYLPALEVTATRYRDFNKKRPMV
jgi:hypothetical protein